MKSYGIYLSSAFLLLSVTVGCEKKQPEQSKPPEHIAATPHASSANSIAGVTWTVPNGWSEQPGRAMRVATYSVPATEGNTEDGEVAVFYFGGEQGGGVDANIERWINQFEAGAKHSMSEKKINGMAVKFVQVAGAYLAPAGPMMQSQGKKENFRLLGAIVEAPEGLVFFKFTGPAKTIAQTENDFNALIGSITK